VFFFDAVEQLFFEDVREYVNYKQLPHAKL